MSIHLGLNPIGAIGQAVSEAKDTICAGVGSLVSNYATPKGLIKNFTPYGGVDHVKQAWADQKEDRKDIRKIKKAVSKLKEGVQNESTLKKDLKVKEAKFSQLRLHYKAKKEEVQEKTASLQDRVTVLNGQLETAETDMKKVREAEAGNAKFYNERIKEKQIRLDEANSKAGFFNSFFSRLGLATSHRKEAARLEKQISLLHGSWVRANHNDNQKLKSQSKAIDDIRKNIQATKEEVSTLEANLEEQRQIKKAAKAEVKDLEEEIQQVQSTAQPYLTKLGLQLQPGDSLSSKETQSLLNKAEQEANERLSKLEGRVKKEVINGASTGVATSLITAPLDKLSQARAGLYIAGASEAVKAVNEVYHAEPQERMKTAAVGVAKVAVTTLASWAFYEAWDYGVSLLV